MRDSTLCSTNSRAPLLTEIAGRVAFVTGAGSGIGQALAVALASEGASVVVADIHRDRARSVASEIDAAGGSALGVVCDVSDRRSVFEARSQALDVYGPVSLLFANAGVTSLQPLIEMSSDDIDWIMSVNLLGVIYCLEALLPDMVAQGSGHVVATSSMAGLIPESLAQHGPYAAAKLGVMGLLLNLRLELSEVGITSTVLCPGGVTTRIGQSRGNRPERFGGPASGGVIPPGGIRAAHEVTFRPPDEVAQMVLNAVRADRPIVVTDPNWREVFVRTYVEPVLEAFDVAADFDRIHHHDNRG